MNGAPPPPPPARPNPESELAALRGKLNALSAVIRLGHEAYEADGLDGWAGHVVNNSVMMLPYFRSALVDRRGALMRLVAVTGQSAVAENSEYARYVRTLVKAFPSLDKIVEVTPALLEEQNAPAEADEALAALSADAALIFLVPLRPAGVKEAGEPSFVWLVEFDKADSRPIAATLLGLLRDHYAESLDFMLNRRRPPLLARMFERRKFLHPSRIIFALVILFALSTVLVRIRQTVSAEFEVVPAIEHIGYSPFDGVIAKCNFKSGAAVKKGDEIIVFDIDERKFMLDNARNEFMRTGAQLDLVRQQSFNDPAKRAQLRLLELQREKANIEIERNQWYLDRGRVTASGDGVLEAGDTDKLAGRAVRPGEKLFEVLETREMVAEINLDEKNSSVLNNHTEITLYLHTRPEVPIGARILSVSGKPVLTARKTFCYLIRVDFAVPRDTEVICGMRGIARIAGERVTLGYYLFRHLVLWYRQL